MATFTMPPFTGGPEDDVFRPTEERDSIRGGGGTDTVDYSAANEGVEVNLTSGRGMFGLAADDAYSSIEDVIGSDFNDRLIGRSNVNTLRGGGGDDDLYGHGGDDVLMGGAGDDTLGRINDGGDDDSDPDLVGDAGDDTMMGNAGADMLYGGPGNDRLMGGRDDDEVRGDAGSDMLWGGAGNDMLWGGAGNDTARGGAGVDTLMGDAGNDMLWGNAGGDTLMGGDGNDMAGGGRDGDTVMGDAGDDTLWGGAGDDTVYGGAGRDMIEGGAGADMLYGGSRPAAGAAYVADTYEAVISRAAADAHDDTPPTPLPNSAFYGNTVVYAGSDEAVTIDLDKDADAAMAGTQHTASGGHAEGDMLMDFQSIRGSAYDDDLTGDGMANFIRGHRGDDTIKGGDNAPVELSYSANAEATPPVQQLDVTVDVMDVLWGGAGDDDIDGEGGPDSIMGGDGDDTLKGGAGNDTIDGGAGDDSIMGGEGDDTLAGGAGTDTIDGGMGTNTLSFASFTEGVTVDLSGRVDADDYRMIAGDRVKNVTTFMGSEGDDTFTEGSFAATINGGDGDDMIVAAHSSESTFVGGEGDDTYVVNLSSSNAPSDTITEAAGEGTDTIRFTGEDDDGADQSVGVSGTNWEITANVENVVVEGDTASFINGNALNNMITTGGGADNVVGNAGNNTISTGAGGDFVFAGPGNDTVSGGAGIDTIAGGGGNDTLDGGAGNDEITDGIGGTLTGGTGADVFILSAFSAGTGSTVTITDFSTRDEIRLNGTAGTPTDAYSFTEEEIDAALDDAEQVGDDVRIVFTGAGTADTDLPAGANLILILQGVDLNDLQAGDTVGSGAELIGT